MIDDDLAYVAPWGFAPADVAAPTLLVHGAADLVVPSAHSVWLAEHLPTAELWLSPGDGHISVLHRAADALALVARHGHPLSSRRRINGACCGPVRGRPRTRRRPSGSRSPASRPSASDQLRPVDDHRLGHRVGVHLRRQQGQLGHPHERGDELVDRGVELLVVDDAVEEPGGERLVRARTRGRSSPAPSSAPARSRAPGAGCRPTPAGCPARPRGSRSAPSARPRAGRTRRRARGRRRRTSRAPWRRRRRASRPSPGPSASRCRRRRAGGDRRRRPRRTRRRRRRRRTPAPARTRRRP